MRFNWFTDVTINSEMKIFTFYAQLNSPPNN